MKRKNIKSKKSAAILQPCEEQPAETIDENDESSIEQKPEKKPSYENVIEMSFFATNDKFFNQIDSIDVLNELVQHDERFRLENEDCDIKKAITALFENEVFVNKILDKYNFNIYDLIKTLYQIYSTIFKGPFIKKVKSRIETRNYSSRLRRQKY